MVDFRDKIPPTRCAFCGYIRMGQVWRSDRRGMKLGGYTHAICDRCLTTHFPGGRPASPSDTVRR